jgi:hypothetical protein
MFTAYSASPYPDTIRQIVIHGSRDDVRRLGSPLVSHAVVAALDRKSSYDAAAVCCIYAQDDLVVV